MKAAKKVKKAQGRKSLKWKLTDGYYEVMKYIVVYPILNPLDKLKNKIKQIKAKNKDKLYRKVLKELEKVVLREFADRRWEDFDIGLIKGMEHEDYGGCLYLDEFFSFSHMKRYKKNTNARLYKQYYLKNKEDYDTVFKDFVEHLAAKYEDLNVEIKQLKLWGWNGSRDYISLTLKEDK
jgi:hypothetical protein